jgi:hypothetical protein
MWEEPPAAQINVTAITEAMGRRRADGRQDCDMGVSLIALIQGRPVLVCGVSDGRECSDNDDGGSMQMRVTAAACEEGW